MPTLFATNRDWTENNHTAFPLPYLITFLINCFYAKYKIQWKEINCLFKSTIIIAPKQMIMLLQKS